MASPVFKNSKEFQPGAMAQAQPIGATATHTQAADLQAQFDAPAATAVETGRMTYEGVISKTAGIGLLLALFAVPGYLFPNLALLVVGAVVGLVLGLVNAFMKRPKPLLIALYGVAEGYFLGAVTIFIEQIYEVPGAGLQALLATGITFGVCLWLYRSGRVRYTSKMRRFMVIGMVSYAAFSLVNIFVMLFSSNEGGFGLRTSVTLFGIPLGVLIGIFAVILACISLISDFDYIDNGVRTGQPGFVEWKASFGLILTLVWLYIEFLRIIAIVFGRR